MKKLFKKLTLLFMCMFCLTGCKEQPMYKGNLETIEATTYVKEEVKVSGFGFIFCIFGSYRKDSKTFQRYIFLAQNGPRDSYKINDIHVDIENPHETMSDRVYFIYTKEDESPYLEYQEFSASYHVKYWLHLPKETVLQIANDMFKD